MSDISSDTGKLSEALRDLQEPAEAEQAAQQLEQMGNPGLADRFRCALQRVLNDETVAYLVPADGVAPLVALQRAVSGFRQREGEMPTWAAAGAGVDLPEDALALLGLRRDAQRRDVRPGCILVGASAETVSAS